MKPIIPYTLCILYIIYHACSIMMPTFLFDGDEPWKIIFKIQWFPNFSASSPASSSFFFFFSLAWENVQNCGWSRLQSAHCFPILLLLSSSKKLFISSALPFVQGACHKHYCPMSTPLHSRNCRLLLSLWCEIPHFWSKERNTQVASLWLQTFPHQLPVSTESAPISALAGAARGKIASAGKDTCFPLRTESLRRALVTRDLAK